MQLIIRCTKQESSYDTNSESVEVIINSKDLKEDDNEDFITHLLDFCCHIDSELTEKIFNNRFKEEGE